MFLLIMVCRTSHRRFVTALYYTNTDHCLIETTPRVDALCTLKGLEENTDDITFRLCGNVLEPRPAYPRTAFTRTSPILSVKGFPAAP